jgi:hypothetical protein
MYVAGSFPDIGGKSDYASVAKLNGSTWEAVYYPQSL